MGERPLGRSVPRPYPLVGHGPAFLRDKLGFLMRCAGDFDHAVELRVPGRTFVLVDAEDVWHVLVTNAAAYEKSPRLASERGRRLAGSGLLTSSGAEHRRQRLLLQPVLHRKTIGAFADLVVDCADETVDGWQDGVEVDVSTAMIDLARTVVRKALFGPHAPEWTPAHDEAVKVRRRHNSYIFRSLLPFPERLPVRINRENRSALALLDDAIKQTIGRRRRETEADGDLISLLLSARYEDDTRMGDEQVRDEILTLLITGHETVGDQLAWTWHLLARHPRVEERFRQELADVLADRRPALADLPALEYTARVLAESMRLYPPTWVFIRMAKEDDMLPSGTAVPAGSKLYLSQYVVHRNPRYFPDPERFEPDRFSEEEAQARPRLAYFPFGSGPRVCIGEPFARMEATLALARIAQRCRFEAVPGRPVIPEPGITLHPRDRMRMTVRRAGGSGA